MTDTVERLRGSVMRDFGLTALGNDAAAEIERLRDEIERLRAELAGVTEEMNEAYEHAGEVTAERDRLRKLVNK